MIGLAALLLILVAVAGSAAMTGVIAYLLHRIRRLESGSPGDGGDPMLRQINELRDELVRVQDEMAALTERVEFTDQLLLERPRASASPPDAAPE